MAITYEAAGKLFDPSRIIRTDGTPNSYWMSLACEWYTSSGMPNKEVGRDGDFCLGINSGRLLQKRSSEWMTIAQLPTYPTPISPPVVTTLTFPTLIEEYLATHPILGTPGPKGDKGETGQAGTNGQNATDNQIQQAVTTYLVANPPERGEKGDTGLTGNTGTNGVRGSLFLGTYAAVNDLPLVNNTSVRSGDFAYISSTGELYRAD